MKNQGVIENGDEDILKEVLEDISFNSHKIRNNKSFDKAINHTNFNDKIEKIFLPSKEEFVEKLNNEHYGYLHYIFTDGTSERRKWVSHQGITVNTVNGNISSNNFYRQNKHRTIKIIMSHDEELPTSMKLPFNKL